MMRWIVSTSIRFRFLVVALGGAMMLFGITQLRDMPVDVFPEFAPPKVEIQTVTLGLTPEETETLVTIPSSRRWPASRRSTCSARSRSASSRRSSSSSIRAPT